MLYPVAYVLSDFFTGWFLTGFPWTYLGYALTDSPFKNYAPFIGLRGINALLYIFSGAIALTALRRFLFMPVAAILLVGAILTEGISFVKENRASAYTLFRQILIKKTDTILIWVKRLLAPTGI